MAPVTFAPAGAMTPSAEFLFLFLLKNRLWVLDEAVLTSTHNLCFEQKYGKYQNFLSENFPFLVVKFSIYLNRRVFVMALTSTLHILLPGIDNCPS